MGRPPRSNHHGLISHSRCKPYRTGTSNGALHLLDRAEHYTIRLCRDHRLRIPLSLDAVRPNSPIDLPYKTDTLPSTPGQHILVVGVAVRLRQSRAYRLPDFHTRQIMQAATGHGSPIDHLPQTISSIQVRSRPPGDTGRSNIYTTPPRNKQEGGRKRASRGFLAIRDLPAINQPPPRRPHKHNPGPRLRLAKDLHALYGAADDGRAECARDRPDDRLPPLHAVRLVQHHSACSPSLPHSALDGDGAHFCDRIPDSPSRGAEECPRIRGVRRCRPAVHILHTLPLLVSAAGHGHRHAQDADDAPERGLVRTLAIRGPVAGHWARVRWYWCGSGGAETGEEGEDEGEEEGVEIYICRSYIDRSSILDSECTAFTNQSQMDYFLPSTIII